jgi:hypothetical protein
LKSVRVFTPALDDGDAHAAPGEVRGQRASGGTGSHDDDVEAVRLHGPRPFSRVQR